ncbi:MAG: alanyl-tRNA editing protein [Oscillospiraceae bacterium]|nr:alanyl-tRNA editing protein [Oscillospiraceae bacterium]
MTRRLYYEDSHLRAFSAQVTGCTQTQKGWEVTLDATAFYPEGGGQPCDLGTLGGAKVLDVQERGEDVIHLCDAPVEGIVESIIQWDRRFDLMQQHTGEHMVSGVVCARYGWHNVGFHMGSDMITIDFDGPIPAEDLPQIEAQVNAYIWQDLQVRTLTPSPEELPHVIYRTKRALPWPVRIVTIPGVDTCACCGVHTKTTGEVGLVKLFSCVKFHQGVRIEMACGGRAMGILNEVYRQNRLVSQAFSAKIMETGEAARQMNERLAAAEYRIVSLERQIHDTIAAGYAGQGDVVHFQEGLRPDQVRELADRIAAVCGGTAAVFSGTENGHTMCLVNKNGDVKELGNALCKALNGRGGGKPGYFQGSVKAGQDEILAFFREQ